MSDHERSYYEIALTNGQVLTVFGVLLAVVFGAFVSGMWVARRALAEEVPQQVASVGVGEQPPPPDRVQFFEKPSMVEPDSAPESAQAATASSNGRANEPQGAPAVSGRQGSDSFEPDAPPPQAAAREAEAARARKERQEAEARAQREEEARRPVEVDTPRVSDLPVIQVLSSGDETQAQQLVGRLKAGGHRAFISPVQVSGRTMYRVRVGPFSDRDQAEQEAQKLKSAFKLDTWITTN